MAILESFPKAAPANQAVFLGLSKKQWALTTVRFPASILAISHGFVQFFKQILTCSLVDLSKLCPYFGKSLLQQGLSD
jgi:hypothetical protein